jgi:PAS domain S-box-containing protein
VARPLTEAHRAPGVPPRTLGAVVAASPDTIAIVDAAGGPDSLAEALAEALGHRPPDSDRPPPVPADLIHPDDRGNVADALRELMSGREVTMRVRARHADGRWVPFEARGRALEGAAAGAVLVVRDVSAQADLESALKQAKEQAESANRAQSELLSRMSHELRTPLNAILGFGQLLQIDGLTPEQEDSVKQILRSGRQLQHLIDEVLDIARIGAGRLGISREPVRLSEVVVEALETVRPLAAAGSISVRVDPSSAYATYVLADRQRLKQVLLNLLSNAIKYNHESGSVTVSCEHALEGRVLIRVRDSGRGIAPDKMVRLFTPFERLDASEAGVSGAGLGLALSRGLVEVMGGELRAESSVGEGSTFTVELPTTQDPLSHHPRHAASPAWAGAGAERTILYIEDNPTNTRLIERLLADQAGVRLVPAMKGRLGLELAREQRPDVILLDLHLPDMTGDDVLEQLQSDTRTKDIPVVVISADSTTGQARRLVAAGARHFLTKPLDLESFLEVLSVTLSPKAS